MNKQQEPVNKQQPNGVTIIIGVVIVIAVLFLASRLFGGNQSSAEPTATPVTVRDNNEPVQSNSDSGLDLGDVVVAENVDRDGCAVDVTDTFNDDDSIYAVLTDTAA